MIKLIRDAEFVPDLSKSIHYISWTPYSTMSITDYAKMSWVYEIVRTNLPNINPNELFHKFDYSNETGTLYPHTNITIMPSFRRPHSDETILEHFNDAMKAQNQFIRADNIIFDMRYSDYKEYLYMIDQIANTEKTNVYIIVSDKDKWDEYQNVQFQDADVNEITVLKTCL